ncbi:hypothetical protein ACQR1H_03145 [Bradyrhizobium sp. HKCCYLRH2015]|uniref:hypothetical protein n=1 Tax=Bradyrhizobium sp. HKCCYLRH2015 TaxID=3420742 RepID=UPI003EC092F7
MNVYILAVTEQPPQWIACGRTRAEAEHWYAKAIADGSGAQPLYRVIVTRKAGREG